MTTDQIIAITIVCAIWLLALGTAALMLFDWLASKRRPKAVESHDSIPFDLPENEKHRQERLG